MDVDVVTKRPVIEITIESDYAESAKKYYELIKEFYLTSDANPFLNLKLIDKGSTNGVPNIGEGLEINDVVRGFFDANTYWKAAYYLGGDITLRSSWQPIESAVSFPSIPDIPNPDPPIDPPAPGVRNFSENFSPIHFKIFY
nr:hypothetical protein [uncultured Flavobacterium sp.]